MPTEKKATIDSVVDDVIEAVSGFQSKYNIDRTVAVVDIGLEPTQNGTKFRQLFVQAKAGFMEVSIQEGFKSAHGGNEQRKTLNVFNVLVADTKAYGKLQKRFFTSTGSNDVSDGGRLVEILKTTAGVQ